MPDLPPLDADLLPPTIRARFVRGVNGLTMHVLEAGFDPPGRPLVLLLHGFPELAYSWRKVLPALADGGFHAAAPDLRGYGRTTGWVADYDTDLAPFGLLGLAADAVALVFALGHRAAAAVMGHDAGASVAACCALARPDLFARVVVMSAPFTGASAPSREPVRAGEDIDAALARLDPPRKHYQWYFSTRAAAADMHRPPQGLHAMLRAYYHYKSADWPGNQPFPLGAWKAEELARLPTYYVMPLRRTMPETVAAEMPTQAEIAACAWLPERELAVYADEFARTGFQGALNWYRARTSGRHARELALFAGRTIDVPAMFVAGANDWGIQQVPGALDRMCREAFTRMAGCHLIPRAGHWVQQERPGEAAALLLDFLGPPDSPTR
jgi:pimeloyl-ACP methyl ester carboxylesterase